jgi:hypothetical protein
MRTHGDAYESAEYADGVAAQMAVERGDQPTAAADCETHDVLIVDPVATTMTILGPMAESAARSLALGLTRRPAAPDGAEIHVRDHSDACTHDGFEREAWRDPERVADLTEAEAGPPVFPRARDVLAALGDGQVWNNAVRIMSGRDAERERDKQITENVAALVTRANAAATALGDIERAVIELVRYYDAEICDGWDEADLRQEIEVAGRALRSIARIAEIRAAKEG